MNALKLSLSILALIVVAGCGDKKENNPINESGQGALEPNSVEAKNLVAGPWCKIEMRGDKKYYEGRQFYRYDGVIVATSYELDAQGNRVREVKAPHFDGLIWALEDDQLTHQMGEAKITFTVSYSVKNQNRQMRLTYAENDPATYEDFYGCP